MTNEANAAIAGALEAGAKAVLVNDSHWLMRNLLAEELNPAAELLSGGPKRLSMVEGIDGGFDAAMFIGYHARAGTRNATIDHTYTSRVYEARLNGEPVGELALNAAMAGVHGVPVALVSGDQALAAEARALLGDGVETVVVKEAVGRFAARSLAPSVACERIRAGAAAALRRKHKLLKIAAADPAGGGFRADPDGGHGGAGAGIDPDRRADRQLQRRTTTGRCSGPGGRCTTWPA